MITGIRVRGRRALALIALIAALMAGCGQLSRPWGDLQVARGSPIRIGLLTDVDAPGAGATGQANAPPEGRVDGHLVEIVPVPVHCQAGAAAATAPDPAALAGLAGVVGSGCSSACVYAESLLFQQKTTLVASGCTAMAVLQTGYPIAFRIVWDDVDQAIVAADYGRLALGAGTAAVVSDGSAYARALLPAYTARFKSRGGKTVDEVDVPASGAVNVPQVAAQIEAERAQTVLLAISRPDTSDLFAQLQAALPGETVIATDTVFAPAAGPPPAGLVAVGLTRGANGWTSELDLGPLTPDLFAAQESDALTLYAQAIGEVARPEPDGRLRIPLQALRDAIARLRLSGQTGRIDFDTAGDRRHDVGAALYRLGEGAPVRLRVYVR
jgi:ABC-type branched-subunit amino acid transport system substrate-binding protein